MPRRIKAAALLLGAAAAAVITLLALAAAYVAIGASILEALPGAQL